MYYFMASDIVSSAESTGAVGEKETGPSEVQDGVHEDQAALQLDVFGMFLFEVKATRLQV